MPIFSCTYRCLLMLICVASSFAMGSVSTPGEFRVNEMGAATYSIQIKIPPGIKGVEPNLSFSYNSQSGNGLMGQGWGLSGLSTISRCPQTLAQDNVVVGVQYATTDRFCLDGSRLVIASGDYGASGAEYKTEHESFSRIISYGQQGNGPASFIVWKKDGRIMEYGLVDSSYDAQIRAENKDTVAIWALKRVRDRKGNEILITYESAKAGEYHPLRMAYAYNTKADNNTPKASVEFTYEDRPDPQKSFLAGGMSYLQKRLIKVSTYSSGVLVKNYNLSYESNAAYWGGIVPLSRLRKIEECGADGACLVPTNFLFANTIKNTFSVASTSINDANGSGVSTNGDANWQTADVNGDGRADLVHFVNDSGWMNTFFSNGDGTFHEVGFQSPSDGDTCLSGCGKWIVADVNGDGRNDFIHLIDDSTGRIFTWLSNGDGTYKIKLQTSATDNCIVQCGRWFSGDINRDGFVDLVKITDYVSDGSTVWPQSRTYVSKGDGTYSEVIFDAKYPADVYRTGSWFVGDVNKDGKVDVVHISTDHGQGILARALQEGLVYTWISNGDGNYTVSVTNKKSDWCVTSCGYWRGGDFNGDGSIDLMHFIENGRAITWISKADSTHEIIDVADGRQEYISEIDGSDYCIKGCSDFLPADVNGDGKVDFVHFRYPGDYRVVVWISKGDGTFTKSWFSHSTMPGSVASPYQRFVMDVNGDGRQDVVVISSKNVHVWLSEFGAVYDGDSSITYSEPLLKEIRIGDESIVLLSYLPTTKYASIVSGPFNGYSNGSEFQETTYTAPVYPLVPIAHPGLWVVDQLTHKGRGSFKYEYQGLLTNLLGRGTLGFASITTTNLTTGVVTNTSLNQEWPFTGTMRESEQKDRYGNMLSIVHNGYHAIPIIRTGGKSIYASIYATVDSRYEPKINTTKPYVKITTKRVSDCHNFASYELAEMAAYLIPLGGDECFGNVLAEWVGATDGYEKLTQTTYRNDQSNWIVGLPTSVAITDTVPDVSLALGGASSDTASGNVTSSGAVRSGLGIGTTPTYSVSSGIPSVKLKEGKAIPVKPD